MKRKESHGDGGFISRFIDVSFPPFVALLLLCVISVVYIAISGALLMTMLVSANSTKINHDFAEILLADMVDFAETQSLTYSLRMTGVGCSTQLQDQEEFLKNLEDSRKIVQKIQCHEKPYQMPICPYQHMPYQTLHNELSRYTLNSETTEQLIEFIKIQRPQAIDKLTDFYNNPDHDFLTISSCSGEPFWKQIESTVIDLEEYQIFLRNTAQGLTDAKRTSQTFYLPIAFIILSTVVFAPAFLLPLLGLRASTLVGFRESWKYVLSVERSAQIKLLRLSTALSSIIQHRIAARLNVVQGIMSIMLASDLPSKVHLLGNSVMLSCVQTIKTAEEASNFVRTNFLNSISSDKLSTDDGRSDLSPSTSKESGVKPVQIRDLLEACVLSVAAERRAENRSDTLENIGVYVEPDVPTMLIVDVKNVRLVVERLLSAGAAALSEGGVLELHVSVKSSETAQKALEDARIETIMNESLHATYKMEEELERARGRRSGRKAKKKRNKEKINEYLFRKLDLNWSAKDIPLSLAGFTLHIELRSRRGRVKLEHVTDMVDLLSSNEEKCVLLGASCVVETMTDSEASETELVMEAIQRRRDRRRVNSEMIPPGRSPFQSISSISIATPHLIVSSPLKEIENKRSPHTGRGSFADDLNVNLPPPLVDISGTFQSSGGDLSRGKTASTSAISARGDETGTTLRVQSNGEVSSSVSCSISSASMADLDSYDDTDSSEEYLLLDSDEEDDGENAEAEFMAARLRALKRRVTLTGPSFDAVSPQLMPLPSMISPIRHSSNVTTVSNNSTPGVNYSNNIDSTGRKLSYGAASTMHMLNESLSTSQFNTLNSGVIPRLEDATGSTNNNNNNNTNNHVLLDSYDNCRNEPRRGHTLAAELLSLSGGSSRRLHHNSITDNNGGGRSITIYRRTLDFDQLEESGSSARKFRDARRKSFNLTTIPARRGSSSMSHTASYFINMGGAPNSPSMSPASVHYEKLILENEKRNGRGIRLSASLELEALGYQCLSDIDPQLNSKILELKTEFIVVSVGLELFSLATLQNMCASLRWTLKSFQYVEDAAKYIESIDKKTTKIMNNHSGSSNVGGVISAVLKATSPSSSSLTQRQPNVMRSPVNSADWERSAAMKRSAQYQRSVSLQGGLPPHAGPNYASANFISSSVLRQVLMMVIVGENCQSRPDRMDDSDEHIKSKRNFITEYCYKCFGKLCGDGNHVKEKKEDPDEGMLILPLTRRSTSAAIANTEQEQRNLRARQEFIDNLVPNYLTVEVNSRDLSSVSPSLAAIVASGRTAKEFVRKRTGFLLSAYNKNNPMFHGSSSFGTHSNMANSLLGISPTARSVSARINLSESFNSSPKFTLHRTISNSMKHLFSLGSETSRSRPPPLTLDVDDDDDDEDKMEDDDESLTRSVKINVPLTSHTTSALCLFSLEYFFKCSPKCSHIKSADIKLISSLFHTPEDLSSEVDPMSYGEQKRWSYESMNILSPMTSGADRKKAKIEDDSFRQFKKKARFDISKRNTLVHAKTPREVRPNRAAFPSPLSAVEIIQNPEEYTDQKLYRKRRTLCQYICDSLVYCIRNPWEALFSGPSRRNFCDTTTFRSFIFSGRSTAIFSPNSKATTIAGDSSHTAISPSSRRVVMAADAQDQSLAAGSRSSLSFQFKRALACVYRFFLCVCSFFCALPLYLIAFFLCTRHDVSVAVNEAKGAGRSVNNSTSGKLKFIEPSAASVGKLPSLLQRSKANRHNPEVLSAVKSITKYRISRAHDIMDLDMSRIFSFITPPTLHAAMRCVLWGLNKTDHLNQLHSDFQLVSNMNQIALTVPWFSCAQNDILPAKKPKESLLKAQSQRAKGNTNTTRSPKQRVSFKQIHDEGAFSDDHHPAPHLASAFASKQYQRPPPLISVSSVPFDDNDEGTEDHIAKISQCESSELELADFLTSRIYAAQLYSLKHPKPQENLSAIAFRLLSSGNTTFFYSNLLRTYTHVIQIKNQRAFTVSYHRRDANPIPSTEPIAATSSVLRHLLRLPIDAAGTVSNKVDHSRVSRAESDEDDEEKEFLQYAEAVIHQLTRVISEEPVNDDGSKVPSSHHRPALKRLSSYASSSNVTNFKGVVDCSSDSVSSVDTFTDFEEEEDDDDDLCLVVDSLDRGDTFLADNLLFTPSRRRCRCHDDDDDEGSFVSSSSSGVDEKRMLKEVLPRTILRVLRRFANPMSFFTLRLGPAYLKRYTSIENTGGTLWLHDVSSVDLSIYLSSSGLSILDLDFDKLVGLGVHLLYWSALKTGIAIDVPETRQLLHTLVEVILQTYQPLPFENAHRAVLRAYHLYKVMSDTAFQKVLASLQGNLPGRKSKVSLSYFALMLSVLGGTMVHPGVNVDFLASCGLKVSRFFLNSYSVAKFNLYLIIDLLYHTKISTAMRPLVYFNPAQRRESRVKTYTARASAPVSLSPPAAARNVSINENSKSLVEYLFPGDVDGFELRRELKKRLSMAIFALEDSINDNSNKVMAIRSRHEKLITYTMHATFKKHLIPDAAKLASYSVNSIVALENLTIHTASLMFPAYTNYNNKNNQNYNNQNNKNYNNACNHNINNINNNNACGNDNNKNNNACNVNNNNNNNDEGLVVCGLWGGCLLRWMVRYQRQCEYQRVLEMLNGSSSTFDDGDFTLKMLTSGRDIVRDRLLPFLESFRNIVIERTGSIEEVYKCTLNNLAHWDLGIQKWQAKKGHLEEEQDPVNAPVRIEDHHRNQLRRFSDDSVIGRIQRYVRYSDVVVTSDCDSSSADSIISSSSSSPVNPVRRPCGDDDDPIILDESIYTP